MILSDYVLRGRPLVRACNDNVSTSRMPVWRMALAVSAVPIVSALLILSILM